MSICLRERYKPSQKISNDFSIGDRVKVSTKTHGYKHLKQTIGTIRHITDIQVIVKWDNYHSGHDGNMCGYAGEPFSDSYYMLTKEDIEKI